MNAPDPDSSLRSSLARWSLRPPADPGFRAAVWQRIAAARAELTWRGYARAHGLAFAGALAAAVLLGGWVGREEARSRVSAERNRIVTAYVQALDARAMTTP